MSKNAVVSLTLQIKGNADQKIKQMADAQVKAVKQVNTESQKLRPIQEAQVQTAKKILTELQKQGSALVQQSKEAKAVELTRKLGLRTEQQIKGEIQQSHAIYQKLGILQRQGVITAKDMERSYAAMKSKVAALNAELGKTAQKEKQIQQIQRQGTGFGQRFQGAVAVGGAMAAGGMVMSQALQKPRDYQQQMTYITATATAGQGLSTEQRATQGNNLHQFVKDAVRDGGGTREDAAAALNELIASGKYDVGTVAPALKASTRTAFAAQADAVDAAKMTLAMQNFGVRDISLGQDRAVRAGQVGSFEYRDMAKFLPEQMAMAKASGYSGDEGLVKLLALNQMAKTTASDSAQAGNNVVNLLQKLSSREFSDSVAKAVTDTKGLVTKPVVNKKGKVVGQEFDWSTYAIQQREQGVYGVEAFVKLLERQLSGNAQYKKLQSQTKNAGSDTERKALLEDMSNIAMGSEMGQIIADRQALMAALAAFYNKDTSAQLESKISGAKGAVDDELAFIKTQEWAKDQALTQEKLFAQSTAYDAVSGSLGNLKEKVTDAAKGNEKLAAMAYTAATALGAVAAAGAVGTVLGGGKGIKGEPPVIANGKTASKAPSKVTGFVRGAGAAGAAYAGYEAISWIDDHLYSIVDKALGGTGEKKDFVQEAIEKSIAQQAQLNSDLIAKQDQNNQLSAELNAKLGTLIDATRANKPVFTPGGSLADAFGRTQENRHGAAKPFMLQHTGR